MADEIVTKVIELIPLVLLPAFYLYSPTSTSTSNKLYISLILSLLATYSYFPRGAFAIYNSTNSFILGHPWVTLSLAIAAGIPLNIPSASFATPASTPPNGSMAIPMTTAVEQAQEIAKNMGE